VEDNADVTRQWGCGAVARWRWRNGWRRRSGGQRGGGADAGLRRGGSAAWRIGKFFDGHGGTGHIHALSLTLFLILLTLLLVLLYRRRGGAEQRGRARRWGFVGWRALARVGAVFLLWSSSTEVAVVQLRSSSSSSASTVAV
jgi:hypothetical protein